MLSGARSDRRGSSTKGHCTAAEVKGDDDAPARDGRREVDG